MRNTTEDKKELVDSLVKQNGKVETKYPSRKISGNLERIIGVVED